MQRKLLKILTVLSISTALNSCSARRASSLEADAETKSRQSELSEKGNLDKMVVCDATAKLSDSAPMCVPAAEWIANRHAQVVEQAKESSAEDGPGFSLSESSVVYGNGTLSATALKAPEPHSRFVSAKVEKCSRNIHVFIGVKVMWIRDVSNEIITKSYVTGANKPDDDKIYASGEANCSIIKSFRTRGQLADYVRAIPAIHNAANPFGSNVVTSVCAPLAGAPCHNAVYEHCFYLNGKGDISNSVGVVPLFIKCIDSIF